MQPCLHAPSPLTPPAAPLSSKGGEGPRIYSCSPLPVSGRGAGGEGMGAAFDPPALGGPRRCRFLLPVNQDSLLLRFGSELPTKQNEKRLASFDTSRLIVFISPGVPG